jgi:signal transduction histidine kinase/CheY-like chemotaxis protein
MTDKNRFTALWQTLKQRIKDRLNNSQYRFYISFSVCLGLMTFILAFLTPDPIDRLLIYALDVVIFVLVALFILGLSFNKAINLAMAYSFLHVVIEAIMTGGMFSNSLNWLAMMPMLPLFLIGVSAGIFWLIVCLLCLFGLAISSWQGWIPSFYVATPQTLHINAWNNVFLGIFILSLPLIYQRMYLRTLRTSEEKQANLLKSRAQLMRAQVVKDNFIALLSHELRTPMNAIIGFSDLLRQDVKDLPRALELAELVKQSSDHLLTVINDVLDFSLLQRGQLKVQHEPFELMVTVRAAFNLFLQRVNSMKIDYTLQTGPDLPLSVVSDRHRLMQILVNLLGNAVKFTHQGTVTLKVERQADQLVFSVTDTGIGIASERLDQIFERFEQASGDTASLYGGNGLGLSISRHLVQLLGGQIGVDSQPGVGSRFWFELPLVSASLTRIPTDEDMGMTRLQSFAVRFLVVDDSAVNRLLACQVVKSHWPQAVMVHAGNGQEALDALHKERFDMVLMDMLMPVMDGIEATRRLRADLPSPQNDTPVLVLTANVSSEDHQRCTDVGANDLVLKPFERQQLCALIEEHLLLSPAFMLRLNQPRD